ncbi:MAG: tRNA (N6-isopentenyl adenosine(37)-C2)-methylthiotransferase MiaB [Calditrichaeota bacterium]|nr:MAG: tRNA (N6-isopentenyl adenosine(37)-C2)-methylthiotransferase MiaB [Calditrichota bacterium]MBL1204291.1 tRNA (N6-isopentenyl adenosine(37)-C2)-methylthiotransferase MiaB [Calditrichota bacterium]NOG44121.1 tRNA (N6-isopentenyl adenosine(37)-C2)-methylthiotransferase MiaB [Calditrichota bacterium]
MKKVYIETYGCQMNEYDSEIVKTILKKQGYDFTTEPNDAHVIFLNTCSVRENAHQKVHNRLEALKHLKRKNNNLVMGVLGCMAQNLRKELLDEKVGVDIVAGPDAYKKLPEMLSKVNGTGEKDFYLTLSEFETYSDVFPTREGGVNAWIAVMRGCDNFCTFCVVPYTRGRERSRDPLNIVDEVKALADKGFKQVTLLGQNVNSYKYEKYDFADLIDMSSKVSGIERIRFTSPHPKDFPEKLLHIIAENDKVCKQIHLPLQAGNTRVLDMMNRTYSKDEFLYLADHIRNTVPDISLSTDIIVGFPTETEEEFQDTLDVMNKVKFDSAFTFKYSERKQTIASRKFPDDVTEEEKTSRITRTVDLQRQHSLEQNQKHLGDTYKVLVEGKSKKHNQQKGRNDGNKVVVFPDINAEVGSLVDVKITSVTTNTLIGEIV